jgi:hypothetical protein
MASSPPDVLETPSANAKGAKFPKEQTFIRFPDEILESIFLEDLLSQKDLCMLTLVSRRISRLAQVSLYSEVSIPLLEKKYTSFNRAILEHPELGTHVYKARLKGRLVWEIEESFRRAQHLLKLFPALRTLSLVNFKFSDELVSLFDIPLSHLRYVSFENDGRLSSMREAIKAIALPQLKRLSIMYTIDFAMHDHSAEWFHWCTALDDLAGTSSVRDLTLERWRDSDVLVSPLLSVPCALEKLTFTFENTGLLTPKRTIDAMKPLYSTLVYLNIGYLDELEDMDGSVADFSCFICLQTLTVDDSLCFRRYLSDRPVDKCGFFNRLPSTLRTLQVSEVDGSC